MEKVKLNANEIVRLYVLSAALLLTGYSSGSFALDDEKQLKIKQGIDVSFSLGFVNNEFNAK